MAPFKAKGPKPEWMMVYDELLSTCDFGDIIGFSKLSSVLGRDFLENRGPLYRAKLHMGQERKRWLSPVPGIGYRVIEAKEHMIEASKHKRKAKRQLGYMVKVGNATEITKLTPEELSRFDSQTRVNAILFMVAVHHEDRIRKIESVLQREGLLGP